MTAVLSILAACVFAWTAMGVAAPAAHFAHTTADEPQYLMSAISLGADADLDIADERAEAAYVPFHDAYPHEQDRLQSDGTRVSPHDPLLPALLAAPMRIGGQYGWILAKLTLAGVAAALAAAMAWVAIRRFGVPTTPAVVVVGLFGLAAPFAVYATQIYPELPAALAVTGAIGALCGRLRVRGLALLGAAVVALPWLSVKYAPVAGVLALIGIVVLLRRGERRHALGFAVALAGAGAVFAAAHLGLYGGLTPYAAGHFAEESGVMGTAPDYVGRSQRLVGLLVDRNFGLAVWAPAFLLCVPALAALARRRPPGWLNLAVPLGVGWLVATFVAFTMHGWWWPGRQVVVVLPAAVIAAAWWVSQPSVARWTRPAVLVAGGVGVLTFVWVAVESITGRITLVTDFEQSRAPLYLIAQLVFPDYRDPGAMTWTLHAIWLAVLGLFAWSGWRSLPSVDAEGSQASHNGGTNAQVSESTDGDRAGAHAGLRRVGV